MSNWLVNKKKPKPEEKTKQEKTKPEEKIKQEKPKPEEKIKEEKPESKEIKPEPEVRKETPNVRELRHSQSKPDSKIGTKVNGKKSRQSMSKNSKETVKPSTSTESNSISRDLKRKPDETDQAPESKR